MFLSLTAVLVASAAGQRIRLPETPAGRLMGEWVQAFNTGDGANIRRFVDTQFDKPKEFTLPVDGIAGQMSSLFREVGPVEVGKIEKSADASIIALVKGKESGVWLRMQLYVTARPPDFKVAAEPFQIVGFGNAYAKAPMELLPKQRLTDKEIATGIDSLVARLVKADRFSGVVMVARGGTPIYRKAAGEAKRSGKIPNGMDTRFHLASITKMFTAVAIGQLVEQGKLDWSDNVGKILPDYPNKAVAEKVTIQTLMTHTSGLIGARALVEAGAGSANDRTIAQFLKAFVDRPLSFDPGARFEYSNAGYILLGAIIEKVSGQDYHSYIEKNVFRKAGMTATAFLELDDEPEKIATGYMDSPTGRKSNVLVAGVKGSPAGGAWSTAGDMVKFSIALRGHRLVGKETLDKMWAAKSGYGFGAELDEYGGRKLVGHGGGWMGITNQFLMIPALDCTIVVLTNIDDEPAILTNKIVEWLSGGERA